MSWRSLVKNPSKNSQRSHWRYERELMTKRISDNIWQWPSCITGSTYPWWHYRHLLMDFNPLMLTTAKTGLPILIKNSNKSIFWKIFEGEMLIRSQTTTLLQIFCELLLYSPVIFKSMRVADITFWRNSKCEWVKEESNCTVIGLKSYNIFYK